MLKWANIWTFVMTPFSHQKFMVSSNIKLNNYKYLSNTNHTNPFWIGDINVLLHKVRVRISKISKVLMSLISWLLLILFCRISFNHLFNSILMYYKQHNCPLKWSRCICIYVYVTLSLSLVNICRSVTSLDFAN